MSRIYARHTVEHLVSGSSPVNTTGQPLGGGPGYEAVRDPYTDIWPSEKVHRPRTREALLFALSFLAEPGDLVWLSHDVAIDLTGIHSITIPDGVTLASDRGRELAPGIYSQGARLYSTRYWWKQAGVCQTPLLQCAGGGRMTGLRLYGPGPDACVANANDTAWSGGSLGFKFPKGREAHFVVDNCDVAYFNDWLVWCEGVVDCDAVLHSYLHDSMRQGYGYGLWPGTPEGGEPELDAWGNLYRNCRHFVDSRPWKAAAPERLVFAASDSAFAGVVRNAPLNTHTEKAPNGTPLSGFVRRYERLYMDATAERVGASDPMLYTGAPPPEGGELVIRDIYARRPEGHVQTHGALMPLEEFDPDSEVYDPDYQKQFADKIGTIKVSGIRPASDLDRNTLRLSLSSANPTAGQEIALQIEPRYPCSYYEILTGQGYGVDDPAQMIRTTSTSVPITYAESGMYTIWVQGFDPVGPPCEATVRVRVEPVHDEPELVFWVRSDWPTQTMTVVEKEDWDNLFWLTLSINDIDVEVIGSEELNGWVRFSTFFDPAWESVKVRMQINCEQTAEPDQPQSCAFYLDDLALFNVPSAYEPGCWLDVVDGGFDGTEQDLRDQWGVDGRFRVYRFGRSRGGGCLYIPSPKPVAGDVVRFEPAAPFRLKPEEVTA